MRETAVTLELKARTAELRERLLRVRANVDKDAGCRTRSTSPNPAAGKNTRLSVSDDDIAALIRDANMADGPLLAPAMNGPPAVTSNHHAAAAAASAAVAAASPTTPTANGPVIGTGVPTAWAADASGSKCTPQAAAEADDTEADKARDLRDWLLFTNFYDKAYRKEFLSIHRRAAARRAALEAIEAQRQKLLEEMEQDDHELAMYQFGSGGAGWQNIKRGVSPSPPASRAYSLSAPITTAQAPSQLSAVEAAREFSAALPVSVAPVSTAPETLAAPAATSIPAIPAAPTAAAPIIPTGPDVPVTPVVSAAPVVLAAPAVAATTDAAATTGAAAAAVSATPVSTAPAVPAVPAAAAATDAAVAAAAPVATAPDSATPNAAASNSAGTNQTAPASTAPDAPIVPVATAPVVSAPVSTSPAVLPTPVASADASQNSERVALPVASPRPARNQQNANPTKRAFDETRVKGEEDAPLHEEARPAKTIRTGKAAKDKAQTKSPSKSPAGTNGSQEHKSAAQVPRENGRANPNKGKAQNGLPPKPVPTSAGASPLHTSTPFFEDIRPSKAVGIDKEQADKPRTKPGPPVAQADGVPAQPPVAARASKSYADAPNGHGEIKIRGTAGNGADSPAQKSAPWYGGRGNGDEGGPSTTNITIAGLARATRPLQPQLQSPNNRTADAQAEEPNTGGSLEKRVVRPEKNMSLEDMASRPLHERVTKPLTLGRRGESRFFLLWSYNKANIRTSYKNGLWVTRLSDRAVINEAFDTCRNVIFFFTINKSGAFQGYARMASRTMDSEPRSEWMNHIPWRTTPPFRIEWLNTSTTSFKKVEYLKNPLNDGASVTTIKDGSEIEEECARGLIREMNLTRDQQQRGNKNNKANNTNRPWNNSDGGGGGGGERSPSYAQNHEFSPYRHEYDGERAGFEDVPPVHGSYRRASPDRGAGYYDDYDGDYGGGGGGYHDSWSSRPGNASLDSYRPPSWR